MIIPFPHWFANLIFLPGRLAHTYITKSIVDRYGLRITTLNYLEIDAKVSNVIHERPKTYREMVMIILVPFVINNILGIFSYTYSLTNSKNIGVELFFVYLGIAFCYSAFPTKEIAQRLWLATIREIKDGETLAYICFLPVGLINLIKILSFFSAQILTALLIYVVCTYYYNKEIFS